MLSCVTLNGVIARAGRGVAVVGLRRKAIMSLLLAAVLWSFGGLFIKMVELNPLAIAGARSTIAALVMLLYLRKPRLTWSVTQLGGAVAYALTVILFVIANKTTTAANAILLQYTSPIYVALLSYWFLGEQISKYDWAATATVIAGVILFFVDDISARGLLGNTVAVGSGISMAAMVLLLRKQKEGSPLESVLLGNILTGIIGLPFILAELPAPKDCVGLVLLGVVQLGIPYILYAFAIKHVTALEAILIPVIEPILNPVWVLLWTGEVPGPWSLVGGALVIITVTARMVLSTSGASRQVHNTGRV